MNHKLLLVAMLVGLVLGLSVFVVDAQGPKPPPPKNKAPIANVGTAFTYQGQLKNGGALVNTTCDLQFGLWDDSAVGAQVGATQTVVSAVANGLFTVQLNASGQITSGNVFNGDARWLATSVRCPTGSGSYTALTPRQALTPAPMAFALPGLYTRQNAFSPNVIGGYSGNVISPTFWGATIAGGGLNGAPNRVWNWFGTVGGGEDNTVSGIAATIGGGNSNAANGNYGTIGGGASNSASGAYSTIPGGSLSAASHYGEMAYASGRFDVTGDAQSSMYILRGSTMDTTPTELFLDGDTGNYRLTISPGRTLVFDVLVVSRYAFTGQSAGYRFVGMIKNVGGTTSIVGAVAKTVIAEDDATYYANVTADNVNDSLKVTVTAGGEPGDIVYWVATVRTVEVAN